MKHTVNLQSGIKVPALGQGTWFLGEHPKTHNQELQALQIGIQKGMTLIDTAEMYGNGRSESLVGEAIAATDRSSLYLVSKVLPSNANKRNIVQACSDTLDRLGTDYLDLYLYHWRGSTPLKETVQCLEELQDEGKIRSWGVSNFDIDDMEELLSVPGGEHCVVNQVLYHLGSRGIEYSLKPWMKKQNIALMAYCPLAQAGSLRKGLFNNQAILSIAQKYGVTPAQVLLAWVIRDGNTIAIPRTGNPLHVADNAAVDDLVLSPEDFEALDKAYPPPTHKEMLDVQ
ncbi:MAG: aldo/keto reductase [Treponema sp.]|nr:aldo/keto reductase [Treponema sp.]